MPEDYTAFRENPMFAKFSNSAIYTDSVLQQYYDLATLYISESGSIGTAAQRTQMVYLMMGHLLDLALDASGNGDGDSGFVTSSSIGGVSVSVLAPPVNSQFDWWLNQTPFGQQLNSLLSLLGVGGIMINGAPEMSCFRIVGGGFLGGY